MERLLSRLRSSSTLLLSLSGPFSDSVSSSTKFSNCNSRLPWLSSQFLCFDRSLLSCQLFEGGGAASTRQVPIAATRKAAFRYSSTTMEGETTKLRKAENLRTYESTDALTTDLAGYVAQLSDEAIVKRGAFSVVLSGGSLISALGKLVESPYVEGIDWAKWHVFWADERVVKKTHPDSNYKLAFDGLLSKVPVPPGQVYAINDTLSAEDAAKDYEAILKQLVKQEVLKTSDDGYPKFDLLLLGMGPDGHVASLFPGHPLVDEKQKWITHILDSPKPPPERITFTFPVINAAANVVFVATGAGKADMLQRVFGKELPHGSLPAQEVFPNEGKLIWFTDKAASAKL